MTQRPSLCGISRTYSLTLVRNRKEVLRLRSLVLRGRAPPHSTSNSTRGDDPVVARVLRLPDELAWKVLGFWRATSDITGEVI